MDYFEKLPPAIEAVGTADVHRVAQKYIDPDHMFVVAVGDRGKIEGEMGKLGLGAVKEATE